MSLSAAQGSGLGLGKEDSNPPRVINEDGLSPILLVCEHASNDIPPRYNGLGVSDAVRTSHAAWDPGAFKVALLLSERLDAPLVAGQVSRLVYDCNRPPGAPDAIPTKSEIFEIPLNRGLSSEARTERADSVYYPFKAMLSGIIEGSQRVAALVTIHSFTPVYHGVERPVEIGILHDEDTRLADMLLAIAPQFTKRQVARNAPYGPEHGVTHTLQEHGLSNGLFNVMIEVRNDLVGSPEDQAKMAEILANWLRAALDRLSAVAPQRG